MRKIFTLVLVFMTLAVISYAGSKDVQVGQKTHSTLYAPVNLSSLTSKGEIIYRSEDINLPAGTKITGVKFRGVVTKDITTQLQAWIANTNRLSFISPYTFSSTDTMQQVFNGSYEFKKVGKASGFSNENMTLKDEGDILAINFPEPFIYTGGNIVMAFSNTNPANTWAAAYYEAAENQEQAIGIEESDGDDYGYGDEGEYTYENVATRLPVVTLTIEQNNSLLKGIVTDDEGNSVAGVALSLASSDTTYVDTTSQDGSYSIDITKYAPTMTLSIDEAGFAPYSSEVAISEDSATQKDVVLKRLHNFYIKSYNLPDGEATYPYQASAEIENRLTVGIASSDYTANLYVGDTLVATAATVDVEKGESAKLNFGYVPETPKEALAKIEIIMGEDTVTASDSITIKPELREGVVRIGTPSDLFSSGTLWFDAAYAPVSTRMMSGRSQIIYPADILNLHPGTKIKSITFKGYRNGESVFYKKIKAYISNTSQGRYQVGESLTDVPDSLLANPDTMLCILDDSVYISNKLGSETSSEDALTIEIPGGFIYNGESIMLYFISQSQETNTTYYESDKSEPYTVFYNNDINASAYWSRSRVMPVAYIDIVEPHAVSDSINMISNTHKTETLNVYDLSGRRVCSSGLKGLSKGIYIMNGKKTVVK